MTSHENDILTMVNIKIIVFLDVTLCSLTHAGTDILEEPLVFVFRRERWQQVSSEH
jgi:hypothetical protein